MAVVLPRHHNHRRLSRLCPTFVLLAALLLLLASAIAARPTRNKLPPAVAEQRVVTRRRLGGPGSSPPTCRSKCGRCSPCTAVHVPIQPGLSFPLEYYPEAWRCKCGNLFFMP